MPVLGFCSPALVIGYSRRPAPGRISHGSKLALAVPESPSWLWYLRGYPDFFRCSWGGARFMWSSSTFVGMFPLTVEYCCEYDFNVRLSGRRLDVKGKSHTKSSYRSWVFLLLELWLFMYETAQGLVQRTYFVEGCSNITINQNASTEESDVVIEGFLASQDSRQGLNKE